MEEIQKYGNSAAEIALKITTEELEVAKNSVAEDATPAEFKLWVHDCKRSGVHPLSRLLHFTKRGGKYVPIASIDLFRARADKSGDYAGNEDPTFSYKKDGTLSSATVTVHRFIHDKACAFTATARWDEYYPGEKQGHMWRKMPHVMLGKCAEALALRKAFPQALHGLYVSEELEGHQNEKPAMKNAAPQPRAQRPVPPEAPSSGNVTLHVNKIGVPHVGKFKNGKSFKKWPIELSDGITYGTFDESVVDLCAGAEGNRSRVVVAWALYSGKRQIDKAVAE